MVTIDQIKKLREETGVSPIEIKKALEIRQKNHKGPGGKLPGSMNKKKTGYAKP